MLLDLVDHLRCPRPHSDITGGVALVCVASQVEGRMLHEATLGCAVCHARYAVTLGIGWFGVGDMPAPASVAPPVADATDLVRLAALLNLDAPGGVVLLDEAWAGFAAPVADMFGVAVVLVTDAQTGVVHPKVSVLAGVGDALPFAPAVLRGAGLGASSTSARLTSAAQALAPNGRLVAPVERAPPPALSILARDDRHWVAEPRSAPVSLRRAPPPTPPHTPDQ